jgi:TMEM175 potassium channel family protein
MDCRRLPDQREGDSAVPADEHTPRRRRVLSKDRMEGFSDGIYAFAATLLVLDLALRPPGTPLEQVLHAWPGYLAYVVSFLTIGVSWLLHTALTDQLDRVDSLFLRLNLLVLLVVVFLPFPTRLIADALHTNDISAERVYVTMYGLTLLAIRLLGSALDAYARHEHLYSSATEGEELHRDQRKLLPVVIGYVIAILIGLLLPVAAVALYFGIAVYLVVPFREAARVLRRRS